MDPTVVRRFACPHCGGEHTAQECAGGVLTLTGPQLGKLRVAVLEELASALLARADHAHVEAVLDVYAGIQARLAREGDQPLPSRR